MHNSGTSKTAPPTEQGLKAWIQAYGSAHATGMDPRKRCSKYYLKYQAGKGLVGSIPSYRDYKLSLADGLAVRS